MALGTGVLPPPHTGRRYHAVGEDMILRSGFAVNPSATEVLAVLDGPTSHEAQRLPASLVLLSGSGAAEKAGQGPQKLAHALVRSVRQAQPVSVFKFSDFWRSHAFSCEAAGEQVKAGRLGRALDRLLRQVDERYAEDPLDAGILQACEAEGIALNEFLDRLLTWRTVWFSPYTGRPVLPEVAAEICKTMHAHWQENSVPGHCYGAQYWNHPSIRATFSGKGGDVSFHETQSETVAAARASGGRILSWAGRTDPGFEAECASRNIPLLRIEDGFLRSVGLGAGLARGAMLAVDDLGIYYDPSRPSRLEVLLQNHELSEQEYRRGETLIDLIRQARVSKYNFGRSRAFEFPAGKTRILVPGQVADDAAIRKSRSATIDCANTPNVNVDLLRLARARNPDAFLVFKPHPDVETGLRKGKVPPDQALEYADLIARDANIIDLIEAVDALETFSSLSGFEALFRGKKVAVHGAPFYAGWGLCEDLTPIEGRTRHRSLPELVYLALVQYARTIDPVTLLPCTPEFLVSRLAAQRTDRKHLLITAAKRHASWLGRKLGL